MRKEERRYYRECRKECQELYEKAKQGDREAEMLLLRKWSIRIITKEYIREKEKEKLKEAEKEYFRGGDYKKIAKEFGLTRQGFRKYLEKRKKLRTRRGKPRYEEVHPQEVKLIIKKYQQGSLISELAKDFVHRHVIARILREAGIQTKSRSEVRKLTYQKGFIPSIRYDQDKVELIKATYHRIGSFKGAAKELKMDRGTIKYIVVNS